MTFTRISSTRPRRRHWPVTSAPKTSRFLPRRFPCCGNGSLDVAGEDSISPSSAGSLVVDGNQAAHVQIAPDRYHVGAAPLVIATGGVNRHTGIIEGREFARRLTGAGVPGDVIRVEDQSKDTWQNVELSLPYLREALAMGPRLAVVSKWYHLLTVYCLATLLPDAAPFYAISWEPVYAGTLVTRAGPEG